MALTLGQLEAEVALLKEQITDLNNLVQDLVTKYQLKTFSTLVQAELAAIREEINTINANIANLQSLH